jgi:hypothetical protein
MSEFLDKLRARAAADDARHAAELQKILARPVPRKSKAKPGAMPATEALVVEVSPEVKSQEAVKTTAKTKAR